MQFPDSGSLVAYMREHHEVSLLAFSRGKDSIVSWLRMRRDAPDLRILPYYYYLVPGLEFVEASLQYYEEAFDTPILRVPHPQLYNLLVRGAFQPWDRHEALYQARLGGCDYETIVPLIREELGVGPACPAACGARMADNIHRRGAIQKWGPYTESNGMWYPCYDWKLDEMEALLETSGIKLPADYRIFGRSWDGIHARYLGPLKEAYPEDYQRVLTWFPLAEADLYRDRFRKEYHARTA